MGKKMLIDAAHREETRVAVVSGKRVENFDFESAARKPLRGNIYLAKVTRVEPSLQAAFVEYGGNRHGFLAFSEIHPDYYQIPVADRQKLLEQEAAEHRAEAEEEDAEAEADEGYDAESGDESGDESPRTIAAEAEKAESLSELAESGADASEDEDNDGEDDGDVGDPPHAEIEEIDEDVNAEDIETASSEHDEDDEDDDSDDEEDEDDESETASSVDEDDSDEDEDESGDDDSDDAEAKSSDGDRSRRGRGRGRDGRRGRNGRQGRGRGRGRDDNGGAEGRQRRARLRPYKIQEVIKRRQILLVQVVKEERGNKGAALTTYLSLAGRYCVLMPNTARGGGISRKITNPADRRRLKEATSELEVAEGMGLIVRTAGANRTKAEIKRDFDYLLRLWENIRDLTLKSTAPALIYEEGDLIKRSIRDLYSKDIDEIHVDGDAAYKEAKEFMRMLMPSHAKNVKRYKDREPLYQRYGVQAELDSLLEPTVTLKSGGYIVINPTEALVSIDVNSGKSTKEHNIEATALSTNMEAAEEIARQLRLRDMAGLIVIDFIDMEEPRNNRAVERKLKDSLKQDRARIQVGRISSFGLLEMSRQRMRSGVLEGSTDICPHCKGTGHVRSVESTALHVLRAIEQEALKGRTKAIDVTVPTSVAVYILNQKRAKLLDIERRCRISVYLLADESLVAPDFTLKRTDDREPDLTAANDALSMESAFDDAEDEAADAAAEAEAAALEAADAEAEAQEARSSDDGDSDDDTDGKPKRRRRRRRRGGRNAEGDNDSDNQSDDSGDDTESRAETSGDDESDDDSDGDGKRRKRRRRGRRGGRRHRRNSGASQESGDSEGEGGDNEDAPVFVAYSSGSTEAVVTTGQSAGDEAASQVPETADTGSESFAATSSHPTDDGDPDTGVAAGTAGPAEARRDDVPVADAANEADYRAELDSTAAEAKDTASKEEPEDAADEEGDESGRQPELESAGADGDDEPQKPRRGWWQRR